MSRRAKRWSEEPDDTNGRKTFISPHEGADENQRKNKREEQADDVSIASCEGNRFVCGDSDRNVSDRTDG